MIAKVERVVPDTVIEAASVIPYGVGEPEQKNFSGEDLSKFRDAIHRERKLKILYRKPGSEASERIVWPIAIGYFSTGRILVGWCETSTGFRHFRTDRILNCDQLEHRSPRRRSALLREWETKNASR